MVTPINHNSICAIFQTFAGNEITFDFVAIDGIYILQDYSLG